MLTNILEHQGFEALAVLTGIISHVGVTNKHMKCANNNKHKPQQVQKKKRKHDSSSITIPITFTIDKQIQCNQY